MIKFANISFTLLLTMVSTAAAQERPAPEPAPTIDLPEIIAEEEVEIVEEVQEIDAIATEENGLKETDSEPIFETEVEVIVGDEPSKLIRWPSKRKVPEGQVILAFEDVVVTETFNFIAETTGKIVIPIKKMIPFRMRSVKMGL